MKRFLSVLLLICLLFSLPSCSDKKAFELSKIAYDNISSAYDIIDKISSDIYEAWRLAIYDKDEILENGLDHLSPNLSASKDDLVHGFIHAGFFPIEDYISQSDEEKLKTRNNYVELNGSNLCDLISIYDDSLFNYCVESVIITYEFNGEYEEAQSLIDQAKSIMKELSEKYSDYEHYPNLKEYFTTTSAYLDFCKSPTGSFEQLKDTLNNYQNEIRDYSNDLDFIFEDE